MKELDKILKELCIQKIGSGYIDLICPTESVNEFINKMNDLNIRITGFTWWCHASDTHEACGMGGPKCTYTHCNEEIRTFLLNEYPKSREYKPCYVPGFWLDIDD